MTPSRTVRVFLSSTFRDFGEERDLLVRKVFPALRAKLKDRFVELVDVDLRWGITPEQAERGEVLPICLAEIDRSRPYFIGLLGERYGWVPPKDKYPVDLVRQRRWLKAHQGGKSVTELEILHGVLNEPKMAGWARFYVRSSAYAKKKGKDYLPQDAEERRRQQALKKRVAESGFPIIRYATPKDLAKRLERDLWTILDELFPADQVPDAFERERLRHEAYAAPRRRLYLGGEGYTNTLTTLLKREPRILITGQSGGGKSALLANALVNFRRKHPRIALFEHYLGASADAAESVALVRRLIEFIKRQTGSTEAIAADPKELFESLPTWFGIANAWGQKQRTRFVFVLDALNNLTTHRDLRWLPAFLPERVQVVISCLEGEVKEALETKGPWQSIAIEPLTIEGQAQLLRRYLDRYNKVLPEDLAQKALSHPLANNPLWLKTLAEELRLFGRHEELATRLETLLGAPQGKSPTEPPTVDDLFEHVLTRIEADHGKALVRAGMSAIWASRAGLSEPEILEITKSTPADWAAIRYALDEMLLESGGRIVFGHDYAKIAVKDRYLPREALQRRAHRDLAKYFSVKTLDARTVHELPYQLQSAQAWRDLERTLTQPQIFEALKTHTSDEEHRSYWLALEAARGKLMLEKSLQRAWQRWKLPKNKEQTGNFANTLARFLQDSGRGLTGSFVLALAKLALEIEEKIYGADSAEAATRLNNLGLLLSDMGDYAGAESLYRRALAIMEKANGPEHPSTGISLNNLGLLLQNMGDYSGAEPLYRRALAISEKANGPEHPSTGTSLNNLGSLLENMGDYAGAEPLLRQALAISEKANGPEHPSTATLLNNLGLLLSDRGDYAEAEPLCRRALVLKENHLGAEHEDVMATLNTLGDTLRRLGRLEEAGEALVRAVSIAEKRNFGGPFYQLGQLRLEQKDYVEAESLLRRCLAIRREKLKPDDQAILQALKSIAEVCRLTGREEEAEALLAEWVGSV